MFLFPQGLRKLSQRTEESMVLVILNPHGHALSCVAFFFPVRWLLYKVGCGLPQGRGLVLCWEKEKGWMRSPCLLLLTVASVCRSGSALSQRPQRWLGRGPKPVNTQAWPCHSQCPGEAHPALRGLPAGTEPMPSFPDLTPRMSCIVTSWECSTAFGSRFNKLSNKLLCV